MELAARKARILIPVLFLQSSCSLFLMVLLRLGVEPESAVMQLEDFHQ